jgi:outer membrane protein W
VSRAPHAFALATIALAAWHARAVAEPASDDAAPTAPAAATPGDVDAPPVAAPPAPRKRFYLRAGVALVKPLSSSRELTLADIDGPASLAVSNGPIAGSGATLASATIPALIVGYVLPWGHDRLSIETVLGPPFTVKFQATGTLVTQSIAPMALGLPTGVPALGPEIGEATAAPPVVTLVYRLLDRGAFQPFAGGGVGVLFAFGAKVTNPVLTAVSQPQFDLSPAPGLVLQTGADLQLSGRWYARLDVKFIAFMLAHAELHHIQVQTPTLPLFGTAEVGTAKMDVWVNPLIVQAGVGADF